MADQHLYVVSFGNSGKFLLKASREEAMARLANIEKQLDTMLHKTFHQDSFAYFVTPRVTEVDPSHEPQYREYRPLDEDALSDISAYLRREVENMENQHNLNLDAPFSSVKGKCAPVNTNLGHK